LGNRHDAEDAFQASFLVLARKARSVRQPALLGNWLYQTAYRVALRAKQQAILRQAQEREVFAMRAISAEANKTWHDVEPILDEEVNRLPEQYRALILLCYFQGKSYGEAAELLGCPAGTVSGRLARARRLLRDRLRRRGLACSATALLGTTGATAGPVAAAILKSTIHASLIYAAGHPDIGEIVSSKVLTLAEGAMPTMLPTKAKLLIALLLVALASGAGLGLPHHAAALGQARVAAAEQPTNNVTPPVKSVSPDLSSAWADLASNEDNKFIRASLTFGSSPAETVAFLNDRLPPVKANPDRVARWIADLDSSEFATRQRAAEELEYLGKYVKADLEKAMASKPSLEVAKRLQSLLEKLVPKQNHLGVPGQLYQPPYYNQFGNLGGQFGLQGNPFGNYGAYWPITPTITPATPTAYWLRATRAIAILEHIATPEARRVLESLAQGEAEAKPTAEAKHAVDRLSKR
jgi:RNA polymerase sigma factor (sigma-70 family)